jgi:hypothetical protein
MSTEALRIKWVVSGTDFYESFYDYEVLLSPLSTDDDDLFKELADNEPIRISRSGLRSLVVNFQLQSTNDTATSTLSKLRNIDSIDDTLYIYYKYISDNTAYIKAVLPKGQIFDELVISGKNSGRKELQVQFLESET